MTRTQEEEMLRAHKTGMAMYHAVGDDLPRIVRCMTKVFLTEHEREAFEAGFKGAKRRANGGRR